MTIDSILANVEIGVDCVEVNRFKKMNITDFQKGFTEDEIRYCDNSPNPRESYAVRFSAKEAVMKALMKFEKPLRFSEILIFNDSSGKPHAKILKSFSDSYDIKLSLSHTSTTALAVALVIKIS